MGADEWTWVDVSAAEALGISRRRLLGPEYERATSGAYVPAGAPLSGRCRAVLSRCAAGTVVSHWTAVALLRLPLPRGRPALPVHVTTPGRPHRATRRLDLVGHTAQGVVPTVRYDDVAVTAPVRTWCDLARCGATREELVVVGDALLHRWPRLAELLKRSVAAGRHRRGVRTARSALPLLDGRSESPPESLLRMAVLDAGLPPPTPQLVVRDAAGRFVARVDLAWQEHRVVVEYDGRHHLEPRQRWRDLVRREQLEALGWRVVVLTAEDLRRGPGPAVARIRAALYPVRAAA